MSGAAGTTSNEVPRCGLITRAVTLSGLCGIVSKKEVLMLSAPLSHARSPVMCLAFTLLPHANSANPSSAVAVANSDACAHDEVLRITTSLVQTDVIVLDKKGRPSGDCPGTVRTDGGRAAAGNIFLRSGRRERCASSERRRARDGRHDEVTTNALPCESGAHLHILCGRLLWVRRVQRARDPADKLPPGWARRPGVSCRRAGR